MFFDPIAVMSCSNLTCPSAPFWYDLGENFFAHLGLGAALGWLLPSRWAGAALAALAVKEAGWDIPGNPVLVVVLDSTLDLAATTLGLVLTGRRSRGSAGGGGTIKGWNPPTKDRRGLLSIIANTVFPARARRASARGASNLDAKGQDAVFIGNTGTDPSGHVPTVTASRGASEKQTGTLADHFPMQSTVSK